MLVTFIITGSVFTSIIISDIREGIYQEKKEQSKNVIDSSLGILEHYHRLTQKKVLSEKEAKRRAIKAIKKSTYGPEERNYIWINDFQPRMIMHPFKSELNGQDLSNSKGPDGKYLFREVLKTVKEQGSSYIKYKWQYYDNEERVEPKISYVKSFKPWGWILGTGVYINNVEDRINQIRNKIVSSAIVIMILVVIIVYFFANIFLAPIIAASKFANKISQGNLDIKPLQVKTKDEIGDLLTSLNGMKDKLGKQINRLDRANKDLKREKDKLKKYLDVAEVVFLVLDTDGKVVLINDKGCKILGYSEQEIVGKKWIDSFVKEEERNKVKEVFEKILMKEQEMIEYFENSVLAKNGEEITFVWHNTILKDKEGNIEGGLASGMDVTERRILKEKLKYSKLKTEFLANLSHELKTPLNLIFSALQMLNLLKESKSSETNEERFDRYLYIIKQNSYRLLRLVNNLIDISKIHANCFDLHLQNHNIVEIVREIALSVKDYIENKDRKLRFNSETEEKIVACDPFNIERIMLNLLSNAVKFTDEGDEISVNIYDEGEKILISVKDTGIGIPAEKQEIIFERFGQADKSFTRNSEGSGIGLSIVKLLVEMHEGEIEVESEYGTGSEFIIELPAKPLSKEAEKNNYENGARDLTDRIDVEFSDIYDL